MVLLILGDIIIMMTSLISIAIGISLHYLPISKSRLVFIVIEIFTGGSF